MADRMTHKYVAKIPVGTYNGGTTKYRYFYSMDEYEAYKNKGDKQYVKVGNRGLFNVDVLGNYDSAEDYRLAGYSNAKNPYVRDNVKSKFKPDESLKSPRDELQSAINDGKEFVAESSTIFHTPIAKVLQRKSKSSKTS